MLSHTDTQKIEWILPFQSKEVHIHKYCTSTKTASGWKGVNTFQKSTHTCSLARPASSQQHHVTTSPHFADEWLQQCPPTDGRTDVDQHADVEEHDQGHPLSHSQKTCRNALHTANYCTIHDRAERGSAKIWEQDTWIITKKLQHNLNQIFIE